MRLTAHYFPRTKQVRSWWDSLDAQPTPLAYEVWVYILYDEGDHYFDSPAREAEGHASPNPNPKPNPNPNPSP